MTGAPRVSVVIPTRGRAALLRRSVASALAQTMADLEVVVVVDGADPETLTALAEVNDPRVRRLPLAEPRGGAGARNAAVQAARGEWIAFLDDDDEWLPPKLERQLEVAAGSAYAHPVIACRVIGRSPRGDYVWPRRLPRAAEPIGDYLLVRRGLFQGEGLVQTSMLLVRRVDLLAVPFRAELRRHQEWDWLLRALGQPGWGLDFADEPLSVWYVEEARPGISSGDDWRYSLDWINGMRDRVTPRAYAAFLLVLVSSLAARQGDRSAIRVLLRQAFSGGSPRPIDLLLFMGMWAIPQERRRDLRALAARLRGR
jgi:glycosyltransferase involved in cell wall biosynthesis